MTGGVVADLTPPVSLVQLLLFKNVLPVYLWALSLLWQCSKHAKGSTRTIIKGTQAVFNYKQFIFNTCVFGSFFFEC